MAYSTSSPPRLILQVIAGPGMWLYTSNDASTVVDASGYITNGGNLGMKVNDLVQVIDADAKVITMHTVVTVSSTAPGAVDLSDGTTVGTGTNTD